MKIGENIKHWRETCGKSLTELAAAIDMSKGNLSEIEAGKIESPGAQAVYRISLALGISMEALVAGSVPLCGKAVMLRGETFVCGLGKGHRDWHAWHSSDDNHTPVNIYWVNDD